MRLVKPRLIGKAQENELRLTIAITTIAGENWANEVKKTRLYEHKGNTIVPTQEKQVHIWLRPG